MTRAIQLTTGKSDLSLKKTIELSRQAEARKHNREYVRENTAATNKTVGYVKLAYAILI